MEWMATFVSHSGDQMPDSNKICLPSCLTRTDVYGLYKNHMEKQRTSSISIRRFFEMWNNDFTNVKIPKVRYSYNRPFFCEVSTHVRDQAVPIPTVQQSTTVDRVLTSMRKNHDVKYFQFFIYR